MNERDRIRLKEEIPSAIKLEKLKRLIEDDEESVLDSVIKELILRREAYILCHFAVEYFIPLPKVVDKKISIAGITSETCETMFGFTKGQLLRMRLNLSIPETFISNRCSFTGDEILLAGLFRLHSPNFFCHSMWRDTFGWLQPRASLAFKLFCEFFYENWIYLITDNMDYWRPQFPMFAQAVEEKVNRYQPGAIPRGTNQVICFIDNTCISTARPGGGPNHRNGHRWSSLIQRSFYNGWKSIHGIKVQTLDLPNGMNLHVSKAHSLRHNDIWMFHQTHIEEKFETVNQHVDLPYKMYGDSAYSVIVSPYVQFANGQAVDTPLNSTRESIEWNYGHLKTFCRLFEQRTTSMKLRKSPLPKIVLLGFLFKNFQVTFHGNISSGSFMCQPPRFEDFVSAGPRVTV